MSPLRMAAIRRSIASRRTAPRLASRSSVSAWSSAVLGSARNCCHQRSDSASSICARSSCGPSCGECGFATAQSRPKRARDMAVPDLPSATADAKCTAYASCCARLVRSMPIRLTTPIATTSAPSVTTVSASRKLIVRLFIIVPYTKHHAAYGKYNGTFALEINRVRWVFTLGAGERSGAIYTVYMYS
ncbi:hypothetical protein PSP6_320019 [Paraburkholderia tropica]|nr:hypothetical protein PSP6_320019 [Paraburkholderia tropica]